MQFLTLQNKKATLLFFPPKKCPLQQSGGGSLTTSLSLGRQWVALQLPSGKAEREKRGCLEQGGWDMGSLSFQHRFLVGFTAL